MRHITTLEEYWAWTKEKDLARYNAVVNDLPETPEFVTLSREVLTSPKILDHMSGDWSVELEIETGCYELVQKINPGDVVLDVGAHVGHFTKSVAGRVRQVVAIEPWSRNVLKIQSLGLPNVLVLPAAAWSKSEERTFFISQASSEGSLFGTETSVGNTGMGGPKFGEAKVLAVALDELLPLFENYGRLDFVKMDIEGSEVEALKGSRQLIRRFRPFMVIELHNTAEGVKALLDEIGYEVVGAQEKLTDPVEAWSGGAWRKTEGLWHCRSRG